MTRRCSHCSNNGHNSRTCPSRGGGVKLFGVRLTDGSIIKKSASMGNLNLSQSQSHHQSPSSSNLAANPTSPCSDPPHDYLSDDPAHVSNRRAERKKGVPWSEEEHRLFLIGLQKLGKGDWRGIARNFVVSRTPTQVASHAQKYFIRHTHSARRKRRSSLFDMLPDHVASSSDQPSVPEEQVLLPPPENSQPCNGKSQPSLDLSLKSEFEPMAMETNGQENVQQQTNETMMLPMASHGFFPAYLPVPFPIWPSTAAPPFEEEQVKTSSNSYHHQIHRPIPVIPKEPVNFDQLVGMSHLSIEEAQPQPLREREPSPLSLKLLGEPSRQSAFHANAPVATSDLNNGKDNAIQAV